MNNPSTHQSPSTPPIIESQSLHKVFSDFWRRPRVNAVTDLSFSVRRGEVFGLLGPNGSGKSTTIKMILGLLHPTRGLLQVLGKSPREVKTKQHIGYLPEESYLYPYLTSQETLNFYGKLFDLGRQERRERIDQLLEMIGLTNARHRIVGEFSKGMARRIGLAQALINDPDLVILDEPTSGLDPLGTRQVKDLILDLAKRGKTVLLSSHLLADVEDICDRIIILYNGKVQATGSINDLLAKQDRYRVTLPDEVSSDVLKKVLVSMRDVLGNEPEVEHQRMDLEQFFLHVVEQARAAAKEESSGVEEEGGVAAYLSSDSGEAPPPRVDLNALVQAEGTGELAETTAPEKTPLPAPETNTLDEEQRKNADAKLKDFTRPE